MPVQVGSSQDGPKITVNALIKNPTLIRAKMLQMANQAFLVDALLRGIGSVPSGVVEYFESTPLFLDDQLGVVEEFGEIPVIQGSLGVPKAARSVKRAGAVEISREMKSRENIDRVNIQMTQVNNTMLRTWEDTFLSMILANPNVHTMNVTTPWDVSTATIRKDIGAAKKLIVKSASDGDGGSNRFGFRPDTLVIPEDTETDFLESDEVNRVFRASPLAPQAPEYTGTLPNTFYGINVMKSWRLDSDTAILLQRKVIGGIGDEYPYDVTPLYEQRSHQKWRSDASRRSLMFLDQPKAACIITNVST